MDVYRVINESKKQKLIDTEEINKLFSLSNDAILLRIAAQEEGKDKDEKSNKVKLAELILKNKNNYWESKRNDNLDDFTKKLNSDIKKEIKKDRKEAKEELFDNMNIIAKDYQITKATEDTPNIIIFKMFLNEWNTKYAFTWKSFKNLKKNYEKTHILEGEDLFVLKSLLEKDPNIVKRKSFDLSRADFSSGKVAKNTSGKITDSTVFSKSNNTLSKLTIEKIKEKIAKAE